MYTYSLNVPTIIVTGAAIVVADDLEDDDAPLDRVCALVPGSIAWDDCDCGQLAQTIVSITPSNNFPSPASDTAETGCGPNQLIVTVQLSVARCVTGPDDNGRPPSCEALLDSAVRIERDRYIVRQAIRCYLRDLYDRYFITGFTVSGTTVSGPEGLCASTDLTYSFGIANAGCC